MLGLCAMTYGVVGLAQTAQPQTEWVVPDLPDALHAQLCHKDFLRFWRIKASGGTGNWHLYNEEDKAFLSRWKEAVQWTALEGKLPK